MAEPTPFPNQVRKPLTRRPLVLVLLVSLGLHLLAGVIFGGLAIYRILQPPPAELEVVAPLEATSPRTREYKLKTTRTQRATAMPSFVPITVDAPTDISLPAMDIPNPAQNLASVQARGTASGVGTGLGTGAGTGGFETLFGNTSPLLGALEGTFFDLKQDRDREDTPDEGWMDVGDRFLRRFEDRDLRDFFRAPQQLYATHFYIPMIDANEATRAFGVEHVVEPRNWIAVYRGQFQAPETGRYRFVGTADDILIIAVDGDVVFSGGFEQSNPSGWEPSRDPEYNPPPVSEYLPRLTVGDWFTLNEGEPQSLGVVIGEIPGGEFASYLFIEQEGETYERTEDGRPILPIFKLKELSASERERLAADGYAKQLDGPVFGYY